MQEAIRLIQELQAAKGAKEKQKILTENKNNQNFTRLLYYACHPRLTYKISEGTLAKAIAACEYDPVTRPIFRSIFDLCETLGARKAVDEATLNEVVKFLLAVPEQAMLVYGHIIAGTLRLGVTHKSINKAIPGLIPEWNVQQAYPIDDHPLKPGVWFALTQKLNGVRATFYRGQMIARSGAVIDGLDHIVDELSPWPDLVFDGELTLKDNGDLSDNEAFRIATGIINSDDNKSRICFTIFDVLPVDEFDTGASREGYADRRVRLGGMADALALAEHVSVLPLLYVGNDQSKVDELLDRMVTEDKEGLMLNLDEPYKCKRHSGILKVKRFYTMDLPIIRIEEGSGKLSGTTGAIVVDFKDNEVGVGTGLTDEQRTWFWENRDDVVGALVEVKYKEISYDKKTGAESLQFPVFVRLRTDKDQVSYG